jgi:predicted ATP-grasp superfamily ATP-dependent carboligase
MPDAGGAPPRKPGTRAARRTNTVVGKAILFARARLKFPRTGPWSYLLEAAPPATEMPAFADIPRSGSLIQPGHPILTVFARDDSVTACERRLKDAVANLEAILYR